MRSLVRSHVPATALLLSSVALGVVFASVFGMIPASALPRHTALLTAVPHLNAVISLFALGTISAGVRYIRRGQVDRHRLAMLTSTGLFATFLLLYLYKLLLEGPASFQGPAFVNQYVFIPLLVIHTVLAVVAVPLVIYVLLLAGTHSVSELPGTPHPRVGRVAAALWFTSFALGVMVYLLLYTVY
ncbi:MAG: DUF420 domain-containing protein [Halodesulfurarchaeum sp.]